MRYLALLEGQKRLSRTRDRRSDVVNAEAEEHSRRHELRQSSKNLNMTGRILGSMEDCSSAERASTSESKSEKLEILAP